MRPPELSTKLTLQCINNSLNSLFKHSIIQRKRNKACLKLRWGKIDMASKHTPKVMGKTGRICTLGFTIIVHRCICKVEAEHCTDTLELCGNARIMQGFPYPLL